LSSGRLAFEVFVVRLPLDSALLISIGIPDAASAFVSPFRLQAIPIIFAP
jgi:hypothetical protein